MSRHPAGINELGYSIGSTCSMTRSRNGCGGHLTVQIVRHRKADVVTEVAALICRRCGQAHGKATTAQVAHMERVTL